MVHYRAVILVIASHDTSYYHKARAVWKAYMNRFPSIKVYMLYGGVSLPDQDESDLVYDDISESLVPGILQKTLRAMKYVHETCTYDYLIRTNISTLWDLRHIESLLLSCPTSRCYAGGHKLNPMNISTILTSPIDGGNSQPREYIVTLSYDIYSGVSIILTPDLVIECINRQNEFIMNLPDDISISVFINTNSYTSHKTMSQQYIENCNPDNIEQIHNEIQDGLDRKVTYFRVKNMNQREITDGMIYDILLQRIYGLSL
jgi:hypothetical protein